MKLNPEIKRIVDDNSTKGRIEDLLKRNCINHEKFDGGMNKWTLSTLYYLTYADYLTEIVWTSMERSLDAGKPLYYDLVVSELRERFLNQLKKAVDEAYKKSTSGILVTSDPNNSYLLFIGRTYTSQKDTAIRDMTVKAADFEAELVNALKKMFYKSLLTFAYAHRDNCHSKEKMRDYLLDQIDKANLQKYFMNNFITRAVNESRNPYVAAVFETYVNRRRL